MYTDIGVIILGFFVAAMLFSGSRLIQWLGVICSTLLILSCSPVYAQTTTYVDKTGATVGYGYRAGNQTTYVDKTGKTYGYEYRQGNQSQYVNPTGGYEGTRYRSWDTTDRYGMDPAQRGRREDD